MILLGLGNRTIRLASLSELAMMMTFNTCDVTGELPSKAFIDGAAKNRMWCQNIPSRHQIRASGPRETTRNERDDASD